MFFCLGVSAVGMNEEAYGRVYLPGQIVTSHLRHSPRSFILIEGQQTLLRSPLVKAFASQPDPNLAQRLSIRIALCAVIVVYP